MKRIPRKFQKKPSALETLGIIHLVRPQNFPKN